MEEIYVFTDGSVHPPTKTGVGAYLVLKDTNTSVQEVKERVKTHLFADTSSSKLELQILLHCLKELVGFEGKIIVYTDSQNILTLLPRRSKLEGNEFYTSQGKLIANHELYKLFYGLTDQLNIDFYKLKGHKKKEDKSGLDQIFSCVDKTARKALRLKII